MPGYMDFVAPFGAATAKEYATSMGSGIMNAPSQFASTKGGMYDSYNRGYGSYNQGLASLGNSYAQNYGAMAGGIGQIAGALGNTWNNAQANNPYASSAEAARQMAIGNLGTAAMTSYGGIAGQGLQAWAQNQQGYQKALADMTGANQMGLSNMGSARFGALANLGRSAATYGIGNSIASALPGLSANLGGVEGGAGSYYPSSIDTRGYGVLDSLRGDINSRANENMMSANYSSAVGSLNADQALARAYPERQINTSYGHLMDMNRLNLDASSRGMDQFYRNYGPYQNMSGRPGQSIPTGSLLEALAGGYTDSAGRISTAQNDMRAGWNKANDQYTSATNDVNNLFANTFGNTGVFDDPLTAQRKQWQLEDAQTERRKNLSDRARANAVPMSAADMRAYRSPSNMGRWIG